MKNLYAKLFHLFFIMLSLNYSKLKLLEAIGYSRKNAHL